LVLPLRSHLRALLGSGSKSSYRDYSGVRARLDLNEPPYPPSPRVLAAVSEEAVRLNRYPEPVLRRRLEERLAEYSGVEAGSVVVSCGADLILQTLFTAAVEPGDAVVAPFPAFFAYDRMFTVAGARVERVNLVEAGDEWRLNLGELPEAVRRAEKVKLVVIDNPNNPTGSLLVKSESEAVEIAEYAQRRGAIVVFDEAYYEFSGVSFAGLTESYDNVVVVRTMSKAFALAGARLGYAIAGRKLAELLRAMLPPFLPRLSLVAGLAALDDLDYSRRMVRLVSAERERVRQSLNGLVGVKAYRSVTNFLLVKTPVDHVVDKLLERGVAVRGVQLGSSWFRASIGSREENDMLIEALKDITGS
jgi:histidinol-phosphate aminotransferase